MRLSRTPSSRMIARQMTIGRDALSKAETVTVATIENGVPLLVEAREIIAAFQAMIRKKCVADLEPWLERARTSLVASFANGVIKDQAAVTAAITSPWSNGQTEGADHQAQAREAPDVRSRKARSPPSPCHRAELAPKVRQNPKLTPYRRAILHAESHRSKSAQLTAVRAKTSWA